MVVSRKTHATNDWTNINTVRLWSTSPSHVPSWTWWRHQMETFSALLAICAGNSPVNSPHKGQWRGALMFSLICACKQSWGCWFETPSRSLWRHCNDPCIWYVIFVLDKARIIDFYHRVWSEFRQQRNLLWAEFLVNLKMTPAKEQPFWWGPSM